MKVLILHVRKLIVFLFNAHITTTKTTTNNHTTTRQVATRRTVVWCHIGALVLVNVKSPLQIRAL